MPAAFARRQFVVGAGVSGLGLLAGCGRLPWQSQGQAQTPAKVPRIGFLSASSPSALTARVEAFRQGLREHGYVDGENIIVEYRYADGQVNLVPDLAAELVRLPVDVIVTAAPTQTRAAKDATSKIPIIMAYDIDPVANGYVASLAHPGGNITGLSSLAPGITGKQMEFLNAIVPGLSRVAVLRTPSPSGAPLETELGLAAEALGVQLQYLDVHRPEDIEAVFQEARTGQAGAALVLPHPVLEAHRARVVDMAAENWLPAIYHVREFVEVGGLMSYGVSWIALYRRAAYYVDRILKGTKPADLPVEQPMLFDFVVNMKTAQVLGITFPDEILLQVTEVIQ